MVQIQFLDKNVVGALVPAFSAKPERIVFLYDTRMISERRRKEIEEAVHARLPKTAVQYVRTNMLRIEDIRAELVKVVNTYQSKEIQIDITGGTEIMTAAGLIVAQEYHLIPTYADFYSEYLFDVLTMEKLAPIEHVTIDDYLRAIGGKCLSVSPYTPEEKDFDRILSMAAVVFANEKKWDKFFAHITDGYSAAGVMEFSMEKNKNDRDCMFILEAFLEKGFAKKIGHDRYRYASETDKYYMTFSGIWLELYIYIQAKKCYDDVYTGVNIDWNKRDICMSRDNEIDVVIMKNSQPIFISCKMRPVTKENVYEIYSMAKRLGGSYARCMIATTFDVRSTRELQNVIYLRMEKMKVGLMETKDFMKQNPSDVFAKALRMTE